MRAFVFVFVALIVGCSDNSPFDPSVVTGDTGSDAPPGCFGDCCPNETPVCFPEGLTDGALTSGQTQAMHCPRKAVAEGTPTWTRANFDGHACSFFARASDPRGSIWCCD